MRVTSGEPRELETLRDLLTNVLTGSTGIKRGNGGPFTGSLLTGLVENFVDNGFTIVILELKDVGGDLDQEGVKNALVPLGEDIRNLILMEAKTTLQDIVCLGNQLHVAILDT